MMRGGGAYTGYGEEKEDGGNDKDDDDDDGVEMVVVGDNDGFGNKPISDDDGVEEGYADNEGIVGELYPGLGVLLLLFVGVL